MMGWTCPGYGMGGGWGSVGFFGMLPGILIFVGLLIAIVMGIMWFTRRGRLQSINTRLNDDHIDPLYIAQRRLASGEITITEFEEIRGQIQS